MTILPPNTNITGKYGRCGFRDVDFKTAQDLVIPLTKVGKRYRIKSISIISKTVASLSAGATVVGLEASVSTDTDATTTLTAAGAISNNETVVLGNKTYTFKTFAKATGTLTVAILPVANETVTIGNKTYTFQSTLTNVDGNVFIGANIAAALTNLKAAVNLSGSSGGTLYATAMTQHTQVTVTTVTPTTTLVFEALDAGTAGNSIATTELLLGSGNQFGASVLTGGTDPTVEGEVKIGLSTAIALDNLKAAVNKDAGHGTLYFAAAAHTQFTATTNTDTTQLFVASVGDFTGQGGNGLVVSETGTNMSFSPTTLSGGLDGVSVNAMVDSVALNSTDQDGLVQSLTLKSTAEVITGGNAIILAIRTGSTATTDVKDVDIEYAVI